MPRKTKIGIQVVHATRDSDTTFKVKRSKVNLQGRGNIVADSRTLLLEARRSERRRRKGRAAVEPQRPGRSDRRTAGGGILCRHAHSLLPLHHTTMRTGESDCLRVTGRHRV